MTIDQELVALTPLEQSVEGVFRRNFSRYFEPDFLTALARFVAKGTFSRTYSVSVGTVAVQLLTQSSTRIRATIVNNGGAVVFYGTPRKVTIGPIGDLNAGIPIQPNNAIVIDDSTAEIWAISGSAAQDVRVEEVTNDSV